jgi:hypothetical protein
MLPRHEKATLMRVRRIASIEKRRLASRRFDDELALVDISERTVHSFNAAATLLWGAIIRRATGATDEELAGLLRDTYGIDAEAARRDVGALVDALVREALVVVTEDDVACATEEGSGSART